MEEKKNKALHWPIGIFLATIAVVILSIWTIQKANENPVVMDEFYFDKYQNVELNYNEIQKKQKLFDDNYRFSYNLKELKIGPNKLTITLKDILGNSINDANVTIKLTRPFTNKQDINLKVISIEDGVYRLNDFNISQIGRWQILSKISKGDAVSFSKTDINATK